MQKNTITKKVKLIPIGNSKGIRIPKEILKKYGFSDTLLVEERDDGVLLHKKKKKKLSWEETFKAMSMEKEDWSCFDDAISDGMEKDVLKGSSQKHNEALQTFYNQYVTKPYCVALHSFFIFCF